MRVFRKTQGLTQEELAAQSGVGVRFLRELENGKPSCQIAEILTVLTMLGLNLRLAPPRSDETKNLRARQRLNR